LVKVGTCSWADKSMVQAWYPKKWRTPERRLKYYAQHFDVVEVNSSFYALPDEKMCSNWVQHTPQDFVFHVKSFGIMTRHSVNPQRLPGNLRENYDYELTRYGNVKNPPKKMIRECFEWFIEGISPIHEAGKLGLILFQFPPYFTAKDRKSFRQSMLWIRRCSEVMAGFDLAVEFRHRSWYQRDILEKMLQFLQDEGITLVCVDEPQNSEKSIPPHVENTSSYGYLRLHGRNEETWTKRTQSAAERFKYLYSKKELREWVQPIKKLDRRTDQTFVMFNNCYEDYAPRNALTMNDLLCEH